jgi:hypothetical protein
MLALALILTVVAAGLLEGSIWLYEPLERVLPTVALCLLGYGLGITAFGFAPQPANFVILVVLVVVAAVHYRRLLWRAW